MKHILYTMLAIVTLLLTGCADAGKSQTVTANTKVYFDVTKVKTDLGGKITQYNWELTGDAAAFYDVYIFNNGTDHASFIAPDVDNETKLTFKLTSIESYKCKTAEDSSCKHHKSRDKVKITVEPGKGDDNSSTRSGSITLSGKVKTLNNVALSGAIVNVNGEIVTTRNDGTYKINNLKTDDRAVINVEHPDYFDNTRIVMVNQSGSYDQDINLDKEHLTLSFAAQEGRSVADNHASINFEPGEYIDTKGKKYTENVTVTMSYHNFKRSSDSRAFIGSYETTNGSTQSALYPYGFINMSISDAQGDALKIDSDTVVKVAFPVADVASNEPSIPLWFYNKKLGYWLQEGQATRINNQYIATITRAEAWGLFTQTSKGSVQVCVVDGNGKGISAADIRMNGTRWESNLVQTDTEGFAVVNTVRADVKLTITASKIIDTEQVSANYSKSLTLSAGDNINLSECIVLESQAAKDTKANEETAKEEASKEETAKQTQLEKDATEAQKEADAAKETSTKAKTEVTKAKTDLATAKADLAKANDTNKATAEAKVTEAEATLKNKEAEASVAEDRAKLAQDIADLAKEKANTTRT